jgi:DNA repair protein RecO (recombination protein O)
MVLGMSMTSGTPIADEAVVLRSVAYGEADRIVTLLTRRHGKLSAIARAARRSQKRFGAALAPFVLGEAMLHERRGADLLVLDRFDARHDFSGLAFDVVRLAHASYATELVRELTEPRHVDPALFELLCELYETVSSHAPRADTLRAFELHLLDELGLRPVLDRCVGCGTADGAGLDAVGGQIDAARGGLVCGACAARASFDAGRRALPAEARARLVAVRELSLAQAAAIEPLPAVAQTAARTAMHALLAAHLRGPMRSLEFLEKLRTTP